ncbi:putative acrylyl-CoA reductase AcuI [Pseudobythopirellula maris]|uniref:Putative acrylyl-CoA reductase AcuI n=1 Tax=Pseudobythopirellula maris TaxID=2527991 RepID=A0A5C5ZSA4_9BACT|nr:YhdH/YhfP family quinone oxidoreductase [Pseudobythopirellula maris]TWT90106.1 putative acrylyl-CoA reductase AcuI [Pseudobythopirellula maris]
MTTTPRFPAFLVRDTPEGAAGSVEWLGRDDLPAGEVLIEVGYSSLNYKDALASRGNKGVAPSLPHVPGIDCAGVVVESSSDTVSAGDEVLVTGYDLGGASWGGWSGLVRVPAEWVVPMPAGLDARAAMIYGTAGFTAAQCVTAVSDRVAPEAGDVVVTGATGGVGVLAVAILSKIGYRVTAVTGKSEQEAMLRELGASAVVGREAVVDESGRPMLKEKWSAAVDTVGGATLATLLRSTAHRGVVAACGLVGGAELPLTVYPFILRGVTLAGIDSAKCPREPRLEMWRRLAGDWRVELPAKMITEITLDGVAGRVEEILSGQVAGRTLVLPTRSSAA